MEMDRFQKLRGRVVAVVRSYNNRYIYQQVKALLDDIGVGHVVVVTKATDDLGATQGWLDSLLRRPHPRLTVIALEKYSWTAGLNEAIRWTFAENLRRLGDEFLPQFNYILSISVEAKMTAGHLDAMLLDMEANPDYGLIGTTFEGRKSQNVVDLGVSYNHPRNTLALWRLGVFRALGEFGAFSDSFGGQEDLAKLIEMEIDGHYDWKLLEMAVPLLVDVNYEQRTKEAREEAAIMRHFAYYRERYATDEARMAQLDRIFAGIRRRIGMEVDIQKDQMVNWKREVRDGGLNFDGLDMAIIDAMGPGPFKVLEVTDRAVIVQSPAGAIPCSRHLLEVIE